MTYTAGVEQIKVDWNEIEKWIRSSSPRFQDCDVIIGIARAGVPIAVSVSYLATKARLLFAAKVNAEVKISGYEELYENRSKFREITRKRFSIGGLKKSELKYLIVDDVATTGETMASVTEEIIHYVPDASVSYAAFAVDRERIKISNPKILENLSYSIEIDNKKTWVTFPWIL